MGERLTLRVYKGVDEERFKSVFEQVLLDNGGRIFWNENDPGFGDDCRMAHNNLVQSVFTNYQDGDWLFYRQVGKVLDISWVQLDICEGSLWQSMFYKGDREIDLFSTTPEYWEGEETGSEVIEKWKGHPEQVAALWDVPIGRIKRYMINWGYHVVSEDIFEYRMRGKGRAYPDDKYEYADIWQLMDFLRALGGYDPGNLNEHGIQHRIELPPRETLAL